MLVALSIRDLVLIDRLDLTLSPGLSVVTGETGAGKSILLDALGLALGERGSSDLVRHGADKAVVTASFDLPAEHPVWSFLEEQGSIERGDLLVIKRIQALQGAGRAFLNDHPVGISLLRRIGKYLVETHGQHADRSFVDPSHHRAQLDAFSGLQAAVSDLEACYFEVKSGEEELKNLEKKAQDAIAEQEFMEHAVEEIEAFMPEEGEETALVARRQLLMGAEHFSELLQEMTLFFSSRNPFQAELSSFFRKVERKKEQPGGGALLEGVCEGIGRLMDEIFRVEESLQEAKNVLTFDPSELERCEERLFGLRALTRKYRVSSSEGLLPLCASYRDALKSCDDLHRAVESQRDLVRSMRARYQEKAAWISAERRKQACRLDAAVMEELSLLRLEKVLFKTEVTTEQELLAPFGHDRVEFLVSTNGAPVYAPIGKVASGGELSRFMLALKVILAEKTSAPTVIFDEIDTGMSGAISDVIGQRLHALSQTVQVLAITHSPQVASQAHTHFLISKTPVSKIHGGSSESPVFSDSPGMITQVTCLEGALRQEEVARMLSGAEITPQARAQAQHLLSRQGFSPVSLHHEQRKAS